MLLNPFKDPVLFTTLAPASRTASHLLLRSSSDLLCRSALRCGGPLWGGHPHRFHRRHCLRADRTDLPHPSRDDSGDPGQRRGPVPAALPLRLHHPDQEVALPARAGLGPPRVRAADPVTCGQCTTVVCVCLKVHPIYLSGLIS